METTKVKLYGKYEVGVEDQLKVAKKLLDKQQSMEGITSFTINKNILDEAPQAYKGIDEILEGIKNLAEVVDIVKPIFNFKADDGPRE